MTEDENPRKARRDTRRIPRIDLKAIDPASIPLQDELPFGLRGISGREKQLGREICIATGDHVLGRWTSHWRGSIVYCLRCGKLGGFTG